MRHCNLQIGQSAPESSPRSGRASTCCDCFSWQALDSARHSAPVTNIAMSHSLREEFYTVSWMADRDIAGCQSHAILVERDYDVIYSPTQLLLHYVGRVIGRHYCAQGSTRYTLYWWLSVWHQVDAIMADNRIDTLYIDIGTSFVIHPTCSTCLTCREFLGQVKAQYVGPPQEKAHMQVLLFSCLMPFSR